MKRLTISVVILLALLTTSLFNSWNITRLTRQVSLPLTQAQTALQAEHWQDAEEAVSRAQTLWRAHGLYFEIVLHHGDINEVGMLFAELNASLQEQKSEECSSTAARLVSQLDVIQRMEQPTVGNVL